MAANILLTGNAIFTGLEKEPQAGFVAIEENKILAVGNKEDAHNYIDENTKIYDYGDALIMPGIVEAHGHFSNGALFGSDYFLRDLVDSKSEEEAVAMVKTFAEKHPELDRIVGQGWFPATWNDAPLPSKKTLDEAVPDRPVYLIAADEHTHWLNSRALEEAKVPQDDSVYLSKYIDKDDKGELTGILHEEACLIYSQPKVYEMPLHRQMEVEKALIDRLLSSGITMFNDVSGITIGRTYTSLENIEKSGELKARINIADGLNIECDIAHAKELDAKYHSPFLRQTNIKGVIDGVTSTFTGLLLEPYSDNPDTVGEPSYSFEELKKAIIYTNSQGYGVRLHCIGDGAVRWALDIYEESNKLNDNTEIVNTVEHIETIDPADIKRFKELNVVASMQPTHLPLDMNEKLSRVGMERCRTEWCFKSILNAGGILAFGTDYPVVDFDPFASIYYAVTRNGFDRKPTGVNPEEKITVYDSLRAYTFGGAYACGRADELGTLEPGKLADIAVLDKNLFTIDAEEIMETKAIMAMVDGKIAYER